MCNDSVAALTYYLCIIMYQPINYRWVVNIQEQLFLETSAKFEISLRPFSFCLVWTEIFASYA